MVLVEHHLLEGRQRERQMSQDLERHVFLIDDDSNFLQSSSCSMHLSQISIDITSLFQLDQTEVHAKLILCVRSLVDELLGNL